MRNEDALEKAKQEIIRLNRCLVYEQHQLSRIGTHGPGCESWGPHHYECAVASIRELNEVLDLVTSSETLDEAKEIVAAYTRRKNAAIAGLRPEVAEG